MCKVPLRLVLCGASIYHGLQLVPAVRCGPGHHPSALRDRSLGQTALRCLPDPRALRPHFRCAQRSATKRVHGWEGREGRGGFVHPSGVCVPYNTVLSLIRPPGHGTDSRPCGEGVASPTAITTALHLGPSLPPTYSFVTLEQTHRCGCGWGGETSVVPLAPLACVVPGPACERFAQRVTTLPMLGSIQDMHDVQGKGVHAAPPLCRFVRRMLEPFQDDLKIRAANSMVSLRPRSHP